MRQEFTGKNYYYREVEYNQQQVREFFLSLDADITPEVYDRNESVFFLLINTTYKVENDEEGE